VPDGEEKHQQFRIPNLVDDPVVADSNPISVSRVLQLLAANRAWIESQRIDLGSKVVANHSLEFPELAVRRRAEFDAIEQREELFRVHPSLDFVPRNIRSRLPERSFGGGVVEPVFFLLDQAEVLDRDECCDIVAAVLEDHPLAILQDVTECRGIDGRG
jgi:hypothetical protein